MYFEKDIIYYDNDCLKFVYTNREKKITDRSSTLSRFWTEFETNENVGLIAKYGESKIEQVQLGLQLD